MPYPRQRHPVQESEVADQGTHGPADPRTAPRPARADRCRRPRAEGRRSTAGTPPAAPRPASFFTVGGPTLRRARLTRPSSRIRAEEPGSGTRRNLILEEDNAFWAWAAIEVSSHDRHQNRGADRALAPQPGPVPSPRQRANWSRCCQSHRRRPTRKDSSSSTRSWPTSCPRSSPGSTAPAAPSRWSPPMTRASAPGTRRCRCCSSGSSAWRTGPSPATASAISSAERSPGRASAAPTGSRFTSSPTISEGSSRPAPS